MAGDGISSDFDARRAPRPERVAAAERLADAVARRLGERVRLLVHDNRSVMVSYRRLRGEMQLRVHHLFLGAPPEVARALGEFTAARLPAVRREASRRIDAWVRAQRERIAGPHARELRTRGRVHDLQEMLDRINEEHFGGAVRARIGWGRSGARPGRRSIKTGVYLHHARAIRIHPALDREDVPAFYVEAVVFHEMLHEVVPPDERGGRRVVHGPEFRRRERRFPGFARARAWEREHLHLLLASPRRR
ncbi:MAG TPA: SprT-like domain-containing protein [Anaeromyxobacteraceae bacterium]|nr:SprT-like domain-containing protein [Anaeromyxobacteraceae bacterium]